MHKLPRLLLAVCGLLSIPTASLAQQDLLQKYQGMSPAEQQQAVQEVRKELGGSTPVMAPSPLESAPLIEPSVVIPLPAETKGKEETTIAEGAANQATARKLQPFGYDLFAGAPTTFAPATDIPIPTDYIVGPGDILEIQLYGKQNFKYTLTVQRDGAIQMPELGPIQVAGLQFSNVQELLQQQVSKRLIGVSSSVTLGQLRSIRIFVLGEARRPGSYTVSSLSTLTNALFVSGGISETGSLRKIQLKRRGRLVGYVDLYDLLLRGDTTGDQRLEPGDVIFIPPVGATVGVSGEVRRPAIYELRGASAPAGAVVDLAGGLLPTSSPEYARLDRVDDHSRKSIVDLNLASNGRNLNLKDGDVLRIPSVLDRVEGAVYLKGHVTRPDAFKWRPGMKVSNLIRGPEEMKPIPDLDFGLIVREDPVMRTVSMLPFSPRAIFSGESSAGDLPLQAQDDVYFFGLNPDRASQFSGALDTLRLQARKSGDERIVSVQGAVYAGGAFPLFDNMTIRDLLRAALEITPEADRNYALLVREDRSLHEISIIAVDLRRILAGDAEANLALQSRDKLLIFDARGPRESLLAPVIERLRAPARFNKPAKVVRVTGDVRFPGSYPLGDNMSVTDLIGIAGGLAAPAYALAAEVARVSTDQKKGYLVTPIDVNLEQEIAGTSAFKLIEDDVLFIKRLPNYREASTVTLSGEFMFPGEYRLREGETLGQLIQRAGGLTATAYPTASIFIRESLRKAEAKQLEFQKQQLEKDLLRMQLEADRKDEKQLEGMAISQKLIAELSQLQAVGRMSINLDRIVKGNSEADIRLEDGDRISVGRRPDAVSVFGEVLFPTSHHFKSNQSAGEYIDRSGGTTQTADKGRIYVIRANGEILADAGGPKMLAPRMMPGDTVIVPYDATRLDKLRLTTNIVQIVSQLALTAASMKAVGAF